MTGQRVFYVLGTVLGSADAKSPAVLECSFCLQNRGERQISKQVI